MRFCVNVMSISCRNFIEDAEWHCRRRPHCLQSDSWSVGKVKRKKQKNKIFGDYMRVCVCVCVRARLMARDIRENVKSGKRIVGSSDAPTDLAIIKDNDIVNVLVEGAVRWKSNVHGRHYRMWKKCRCAAEWRTRTHPHISNGKARKIDKDAIAFGAIQREINGIGVSRNRHIAYTAMPTTTKHET